MQWTTSNSHQINLILVLLQCIIYIVFLLCSPSSTVVGRKSATIILQSQSFISHRKITIFYDNFFLSNTLFFDDIIYIFYGNFFLSKSCLLHFFKIRFGNVWLVSTGQNMNERTVAAFVCNNTKFFHTIKQLVCFSSQESLYFLQRIEEAHCP